MKLRDFVVKSKMKIFRIIRKQYAIVGISPSKPLSQKHPFTERVFFGFLSFGCIAAAEVANLFYEANDFMEYVECISSISGNLIIFVCFASIVFQKTLLFKMLGNIEQFLETSKPVSSFSF